MKPGGVVSTSARGTLPRPCHGSALTYIRVRQVFYLWVYSPKEFVPPEFVPKESFRTASRRFSGTIT